MADTKTAALLPAYLVVGEDELKRERVVSRLEARVDPGLVDFNLEEITSSSDIEASEILSSLNSMPFGAPFRLVVLLAAEKLPKQVSEALVSYLGDPNPACVLCLVASKLAKNTRLYKAVAKVGPKSVVDCSSQKRWDLPKLVCGMAREVGCSMSSRAADELVSRVGESTVMLDNQVKTLASFVGGSGQIGLEDVEAHVARVAEVKPWDLLDAVCERDAAKAMSLYTLMEKPSQIMLHSLLVARLRELVCARSLLARGDGSALASTLGKQQWQVKNHLRWAHKFTAAELSADLAGAARCERQLKGSPDSDLAFVGWMLSICG
jgi:DNA polymerase-3 subunit delta